MFERLREANRNAITIQTYFSGQLPNAEPGSLSFSRNSTRSSKAIWTGRFLSGLAVLFLTFDAAVKVLALPVAVDATVRIGYPASTIVGIGLLELVFLSSFLIP